jgi:hypothetical protein
MDERFRDPARGGSGSAGAEPQHASDMTPAFTRTIAARLMMSATLAGAGWVPMSCWVDA